MKAFKYFLFFHLKCTIKNMSREYQGTFSYKNFCLLGIFFLFSHLYYAWAYSGC